MINKFDVIVIGSGSGLDVANGLAERGFKVAIIEKDKLGGTCLNAGCIPSKLLIHSADVIEIIKKADLFGVKVKSYSINYQKIINRVNNIINNDSENIKKGLQKVQNPRLFLGKCKFIERKKILIENKVALTADKILIASGARPNIPQVNGLDKVDFITSNDALRLKKLPKTLTIIGGGYIACELAHFFGSLGTKINIIQRRDLLIPREDIDIATKFTEIYSKKYNIYLGYNTEYVSKIREKRGKYFSVLAYNKKGKKLELLSDQLLVATGRIPNSDLLHLEKTHVKADKKGFIKVNKYLETNV
ncbi:MAG: FAD-dependent oxidoreductase, partial [Nitrososphaeraceae archaeon]|nr:FAD-dependent oxidoreductase [Nitrososphaeraceae archaeon]